MKNVVVSGNTAKNGSGGGLYNNIGTVNIFYSTINDNISAMNANNLYNEGALNISNSTIANGETNDINSIYLNGLVKIVNATIHNTNNNETLVNGGLLQINNTYVDILKNDGTIDPLSDKNLTFNILDPPLLGPLQDNGGPTPTMLPANNSPLVDAGDAVASNSPTDQRGFVRVINGMIDIGSVETRSHLICYSGESMILALNIKTKKIAEVKAKDIYPGLYKVYDVKRNKFVPVKYNIITGPTNRFMRVEKDSLGEKQPNADFFVTSGHKILLNGNIVKGRNIPGAIRIKVKPELVYCICTEHKTIIMVNGLQVFAWGEKEWLEYSKKNGIRWEDNKPKINDAELLKQ